MKKLIKAKLLMFASVLLFSQSATVIAEGDVAMGEEAFKNNCTACHNFTKGAKPDMYGVVLPLYGIVGKEAGKTAGFFYSKSMRQSGVVWTEEMLDKFIEDPKGAIPGIRMEFAGVKDAAARAGIIAFFKAEMEKNQ